MTTTTSSTVGTGGDYTTLAAWVAAAPANLVTADVVWQGQLLNQEFVSGGWAVTIPSAGEDATRYFELTTAPGASFRDHASKATNALKYNAANGAAIRGSGNYGGAIKSEAYYTRITGIQAKNDTGTFSAMQLTAGCVVDGCIAEQGSTHWNVITSPGAFTIKNAHVAKRTSGGYGIGCAQSVNLHNVTIAVPSDVGGGSIGVNVAYPSGTSTLNNVAVFGFTTAYANAGSSTATTCLTDQSSPATGFSQVTYADCFENTALASMDFRVKTGSPLIDAGTTDVTNAAYDIIGTARPQGASYDVGAWEFSSGGGTAGSVTGGTGTGTGAGTGGDATGVTAGVGSVTGGTGTGSGAGSGGDATGAGATGSITVGPLENSPGSLWLSQSVAWTWAPLGRVGSMTGITFVDGIGTTHATTGELTVSGLAAGDGEMRVVKLGATAFDDLHYVEYGTVA